MAPPQGALEQGQIRASALQSDSSFNLSCPREQAFTSLGISFLHWKMAVTTAVVMQRLLPVRWVPLLFPFGS